MSYSIDVIEDLKERAKHADEDTIEERIIRAIDDGLIYTEDILALMNRYIPASEIADIFFEKCYDELYEELYKELTEVK